MNCVLLQQPPQGQPKEYVSDVVSEKEADANITSCLIQPDFPCSHDDVSWCMYQR